MIDTRRVRSGRVHLRERRRIGVAFLRLGPTLAFCLCTLAACDNGDDAEGDVFPVLEDMVLVASSDPREPNDAFFIDRFEVTNSEYLAYLQITGTPLRGEHHVSHLRAEGGEPRIPEGLADHPVVWVDLFDAHQFARHEDKRLPSESEWRRAARPGTMTQHRFFFNYPSSGIGHATAVGTFDGSVSPSGCYDLLGNVAEWTKSFNVAPPHDLKDVEDWARERGLTLDELYDPAFTGIQSPPLSGFAVVGGSYQDAERRRLEDRHQRSPGVGFRCALDATTFLDRALPVLQRAAPAVRERGMQEIVAMGENLWEVAALTDSNRRRSWWRPLSPDTRLLGGLEASSNRPGTIVTLDEGRILRWLSPVAGEPTHESDVLELLHNHPGLDLRSRSPERTTLLDASIVVSGKNRVIAITWASSATDVWQKAFRVDQSLPFTRRALDPLPPWRGVSAGDLPLTGILLLDARSGSTKSAGQWRGRECRVLSAPQHSSLAVLVTGSSQKDRLRLVVPRNGRTISRLWGRGGRISTSDLAAPTVRAASIESRNGASSRLAVPITDGHIHSIGDSGYVLTRRETKPGRYDALEWGDPKPSSPPTQKLAWLDGESGRILDEVEFPPPGPIDVTAFKGDGPWPVNIPSGPTLALEVEGDETTVRLATRTLTPFVGAGDVALHALWGIEGPANSQYVLASPGPDQTIRVFEWDGRESSEVLSAAVRGRDVVAVHPALWMGQKASLVIHRLDEREELLVFVANPLRLAWRAEVRGPSSPAVLRDGRVTDLVSLDSKSIVLRSLEENRVRRRLWIGPWTEIQSSVFDLDGDGDLELVVNPIAGPNGREGLGVFELADEGDQLDALLDAFVREASLGGGS